MNRQQRRALGHQAKAEDWTPFREIAPSERGIVGDMASVARRFGVAEARVREVARAVFDNARLYVNNRYEVTIRPAEGEPGWLHLAIRRHDMQPISSWQDKQRIKNELVGAECEAVELLPATSRMLDMANVYHLWANPDSAFRLDLGFHAGKQVLG